MTGFCQVKEHILTIFKVFDRRPLNLTKLNARRCYSLPERGTSNLKKWFLEISVVLKKRGKTNWITEFLMRLSSQLLNSTFVKKLSKNFGQI